ncbi:DUF411 domain-containing protein [Natronospirillum operosum]|uniref:DUF411 domain-containing protein n=1 Tax=Natronospirillum operosum TaxID=2759953 RepID=A0A4Z0W8E8_9GAMM|nr:DUF411 domain-containing protein [Natronospirillum operosum]TGG89975.1 DUF411 domain-containing protein [Natronospirillum operosum]
MNRSIHKPVILGSASAAALVVAAAVMLYPNADATLSASESAPQPAQIPERQVTMYSDPNCGCCGDWAQYLSEQGYIVSVEHVDDMLQFKAEHQVPQNMRSCHTALIDGHVIEGHVPVSAIEQFLTEPLPFGEATAGLAVPGMPLGSPGMDVGRYQDFDAVAFTSEGETAMVSEYRF